MFRFISQALACACLLALCGAAQAQSIVSDGFNYASGAITNDYGGIGWPNDTNHAWFTEGGPPADQITMGGLSFAGGGQTLAVSGNKLTTSGSNTGAFRNLPTLYGGDTNQTLWIGFLTSSSGGANHSGYAGLSLVNAYTNGGTYTQTENFFLGQVNATSQYGFVNYTPNSSNGTAFLSGTSTDTATHFLVTRFDFTASGSTEVSLFVDPTPGVAPTGAPQAQEDYTTSFVFNQIRFQSGSDASASHNFDELRMGSAYADVAPAAAPEPGGITVIGMGALLVGLTAMRGWSRRRV